MSKTANDQSPGLKQLIDELSAIYKEHGNILVGVSGWEAGC